MANSTVTLAIFFFFFFAALISSARELRPSDHGLVFQTLSPAEAHSTPEMRSFFNSENSSPTMSSSSDVALPRAMNSGAASPPPRVVHGDGDGDDRVGKALKAASLVCGIVGGVLLVASAFIYLYRYPKHKQNKASSDHNQNHCESQNNDDNNNKLQLVVRDP